MGLIGLAWVVFGGLLEPVWVIGIKKYGENKSLFWLAVGIIFIYVSPMCIAFGMADGLSVGIAYSLWTGMGAVFTTILGVLLFKEKLDRIKILLVSMIIIGVVGLELSSVIG